MASSMLAAVREAVLADAANPVPEADTSGAPALNSRQEENGMSKNDTPAGGSKDNAGISRADHEAALEAAKIEAASTATNRLAGILGAEGITGDAARMSAALDLAVKSPGMSAEDVAGFITANVSASAAKPDARQTYEAGRTAAAALAMPTPAKPSAAKPDLNPGSIYDARRQAVKEG